MDSENAEAFSEDDRKKVLGLIRESVGFEAVNKAVAGSMAKWIGTVMEDHFRHLGSVLTGASSSGLAERRSLTMGTTGEDSNLARAREQDPLQQVLVEL